MDQPAQREIVIVRRRGTEEEGHHGGVWKIAYADFMTAMMAFFLVMWLVNAADKKVLTQVASYFNPLRMSDRITSEKGVEDMTEGAPRKEKGKAGGHQKVQEENSEASEGESKPAGKTGEDASEGAYSDKAESKKEEPKEAKESLTEQELFNDPYGVLEKLAGEGPLSKRGGPEPDQDSGSGKIGGEAFRDPFDPNFNRTNQKKTESATSPPKAELDVPDAPVSESVPNELAAGEKKQDNNEVANASKAEPQRSTAENSADEKSADLAVAKDLQRKLEAELSDLAMNQRPGISVTNTRDGLLISLTDDLDFEMFRGGTSEPSPELIDAMKLVGNVLTTTPGDIILRGHTDGRPFKKGRSDNWRLSTQRALMARYMLIRGGVDERRLERVEGYADTQPKMKSDPLAPQNRRIEVLLRRGND